MVDLYTNFMTNHAIISQGGMSNEQTCSQDRQCWYQSQDQKCWDQDQEHYDQGQDQESEDQDQDWTIKTTTKIDKSNI